MPLHRARQLHCHLIAQCNRPRTIRTARFFTLVAAMYSPGTVLFLSSLDLSGNNGDGAVDLDPAAFDQKLRARGPRHLGAPGDSSDSPRNASRRVYQMQIIQAYVPFTMSVVCRVRLIAIFDDPAGAAPFVPLPTEPDTDEGHLDQVPHCALTNEPARPEYILKLYDRRCFSNIRNAEGEQYTEQGARAYHKYLAAGDPAPYFTRWFWDMPGLSEEEDLSESDLGLYEAWLEASAQRMWQKEVAAYNILADLQGRSIPLLFDAVSCSTVFSFSTQTRSHDQVVHRSGLADETRTTSDEDQVHAEAPVSSMERAAEEPFCDRHRVLGILIEYIPGVSLRTFIDRMLRSQGMTKKDVLRELASIGDEALSLVRTIGQYPLVNRDVRIDNMLVRESYVGSLLHNDECGRTRCLEQAGH